MKSFSNTNKNLDFPEGFGYSFGVLINPLVEFYGSDVTTISWASSIYNGSVFMFGPIVGGFANKYGLRPICISGGIVSCFGLCISTLSPNVSVLIITVGVIGGFGASLVFIPANVAIGYYFESKRALATGITHCGSGLGQFFLAPFITFLSNTYSWKIVILIIGGFCLTSAIFGALIRPLEVMEKVFEKRHETKIFQPSTVLRKYSTNEESKQVSKPLLDEKEGKSVWIWIKEMINLELMMKPTFLLVCGSSFFCMIGFFVPLFFLPDMAVDKGIKRIEANFLISIYGKFRRQFLITILC